MSQSVAGLSARMPRIDPRTFHITSVVDKVAPGQESLQVPQSVSFCQRSVLIGPSITDAVQSYQLNVLKQHI
jgi:hypothetical protein